MFKIKNTVILGSKQKVCTFTPDDLIIENLNFSIQSLALL